MDNQSSKYLGVIFLLEWNITFKADLAVSFSSRIYFLNLSTTTMPVPEIIVANIFIECLCVKYFSDSFLSFIRDK